ncbi:WD40/YVTN/BNR-like repeat-containing protein [Marixanthomonas spongiae]|uniref:Oxidoreductase n=1 Tax=Marixanthomonas spongiae TaxID=2174845 RepID=A0A2U0I0R7_9FLAO|nr:oxidoreductase [Marixanthomonas spongiae]PVW14703.1 oxidoreductase [Marixanthomonas spongiae]
MRFLFPLIILLGVISCTSNHSKNFTSVSIEPVFVDSLSIRAIKPLNENRVWFAANKGIVGLIDHKQPKLATIKYEDSLLHFRSIATTDAAVFVLSIASPAVLYKIDFDGNEATNIHEVYTETGKGVFYDSMKFWNNNEGIAMGDPVDGCLSILLTRNGGDTWQKIPCENLPEVEKGEAAFAASNSNISVYKNNVWIATGGKQARIFHSKNKGKDWEVYDTPIIQGKAMTGIYSVDFFDAKTGIVFGGDWNQKDFNEGNKAITTDGGKTWRLLSNGEGPGYRSSVKFVPGTKGNDLVAVGSPGLSYSNDRGETWEELSTEGFYAIEFLNDSIAFASGNNQIAKLLFK